MSDRDYEFLVRFRVRQNDLTRAYEATFEDEDESEGIVLDPKQMLGDLIQCALFDGDTAVELAGLFGVIEVRRAEPNVTHVMFKSTRQTEATNEC